MANRLFSEFELNQSLQLFQVLSNETRFKLILWEKRLIKNHIPT